MPKSPTIKAAYITGIFALMAVILGGIISIYKKDPTKDKQEIIGSPGAIQVGRDQSINYFFFGQDNRSQTSRPEPFMGKRLPSPTSKHQTSGNIDHVRFENLVPRRDGRDVLIPLVILQTIPHFDPNRPVYAATYANNWLRTDGVGHEIEASESTIIKREGDEWRAIGLAGTRFHPLQLYDQTLQNKFIEKNKAYLPIEYLENIYGSSWGKFKREFLDQEPTLCFLVR